MTELESRVERLEESTGLADAGGVEWIEFVYQQYDDDGNAVGDPEPFERFGVGRNVNTYQRWINGAWVDAIDDDTI